MKDTKIEEIGSDTILTFVEGSPLQILLNNNTDAQKQLSEALVILRITIVERREQQIMEIVKEMIKNTIGINTNTLSNEVVYKNGIDIKEYINKYDLLSFMEKLLPNRE